MALHDGGLSLDGLMKYYADAIALAREAEKTSKLPEKIDREYDIGDAATPLPQVPQTKFEHLQAENLEHIKRIETVMQCSIDARDKLWKEAARERNRLREQLAKAQSALLREGVLQIGVVEQAVAAERERVVGVIEKEYLSFRRRGFEACVAFGCAMGKVRCLNRNVKEQELDLVEAKRRIDELRGQPGALNGNPGSNQEQVFQVFGVHPGQCPQSERTLSDSELLDVLESEIKETPLVLWGGVGEFPEGPCGLSLLGGERTLREAIRGLRRANDLVQQKVSGQPE